MIRVSVSSVLCYLFARHIKSNCGDGKEWKLHGNVDVCFCGIQETLIFVANMTVVVSRAFAEVEQLGLVMLIEIIKSFFYF